MAFNLFENSEGEEKRSLRFDRPISGAQFGTWKVAFQRCFRLENYAEFRKKVEANIVPNPEFLDEYFTQ